jgi:segregation and condensation protein B
MEPLDSLRAQLEALLFASGRPMGVRQLAKLTKTTPAAVEASILALTSEYAQAKRGVSLVRQEDKVQMVSNPTQGPVVESFIKEEFTGPLSRAALETLAIIAYRGPIPKPEIDTIRGVNSGIMLRTLLIRGLVERRRNRQDARTFVYTLSFDLLRHLGITSVEGLPKYAELHKHEVMERFARTASDASMAQDLPKPTNNG